jgi:hypothetical protein
VHHVGRAADRGCGARYPAHAASLGHAPPAGFSDAELDGYFDAARPTALTAKIVASKTKLGPLVHEAREVAGDTNPAEKSIIPQGGNHVQALR